MYKKIERHIEINIRYFPFIIAILLLAIMIGSVFGSIWGISLILEYTVYHNGLVIQEPNLFVLLSEHNLYMFDQIIFFIFTALFSNFYSEIWGSFDNFETIKKYKDLAINSTKKRLSHPYYLSMIIFMLFVFMAYNIFTLFNETLIIFSIIVKQQRLGLTDPTITFIEYYIFIFSIMLLMIFFAYVVYKLMIYSFGGNKLKIVSKKANQSKEIKKEEIKNIETYPYC